MGSWFWEGPARSPGDPGAKQAGHRAQHGTRQAAARRGLPAAAPPTVERLPPTPSPTSRPGPRANTKTGTCRPARRASSGAGSTCLGLVPAWPSGTEPPRRDPMVQTLQSPPQNYAGDAQSWVIGSACPRFAGDGHLSCPTGTLPAQQGKLPNPPHGPAASAGAPSPTPGRDEVATAQLLRACGGPRGQRRWEGAGCRQDNAASCTGGRGGRTGKCLQPQLWLPAPGQRK